MCDMSEWTVGWGLIPYISTYPLACCLGYALPHLTAICLMIRNRIYRAQQTIIPHFGLPSQNTFWDWSILVCFGSWIKRGSTFGHSELVLWESIIIICPLKIKTFVHRYIKSCVKHLHLRCLTLGGYFAVNCQPHYVSKHLFIIVWPIILPLCFVIRFILLYVPGSTNFTMFAKETLAIFIRLSNMFLIISNRICCISWD